MVLTVVGRPRSTPTGPGGTRVRAHALNVLSARHRPRSRASACFIALGAHPVPPRRPGRRRPLLDEALELSLPGRAPAAARVTCTQRVRKRRGLQATASGRSREARAAYHARAREAAPLVRGRARILAVEGGRARRGAPDWIAEPYRLQLDGEPQRGSGRRGRARGCPLRGRPGARRVGGGRGGVARGAGGSSTVSVPGRRQSCLRADG